MHLRISPWLVVALTIPLCTSCKEHQELLEREQQLDARIKLLERQISEANEQLNTEVPDVSAKLEIARRKLAAAQNNAVRLEGSLVDLRDEKESLELRFTNYRKRYPIR